MSVGLISEFNPFHYGHKYIIDKVHSLNEDVICIMSGPFVQRGEPACASKYARAEAALKSGADAVVELPVRFVLSAAKDFALGGVEVLKNIRGVNALAFGVECEPELLYEIAEVKRKKTTDELIKSELINGASYPTAVKNALSKIEPKYGEALLPNNILALEYIEALDGTSISPMPIKRVGSGYNDLSLETEYASASAIRAAVKSGEDCKRFLPEAMLGSIRFPDVHLLDTLAHYALLSRNVDELRMLPDVEVGFEYALYKAARQKDMGSAMEMLKSKRYTYARLRRIVLSALLNISYDLDISNIKTRVLGIKESFKPHLADFNANIITRNSEATKEFISDKNVRIDCFAQDVFALLTGGTMNEYYSTPMIVT